MMTCTHLHFLTSVGVKKPNSIRNKDVMCPFCARELLTDIIDTDGPIMLLKNKYFVLQKSYQTVLIETDDCHSELSIYQKDHLYRLFRFAINHWIKMEETGKYESVLLFKNHGPLSGGSIAHPHMQIIGLEDVDYTLHIKAEDFIGLEIDSYKGTEFTLSTMPKIGFYEFNVKLGERKDIEPFARYVQTAVHYILTNFPFHCNSYNLFFYKLGQERYAKIVPRFVTSPLYVGFSIPQIPDNLEWMKEDIKKHYFTNTEHFHN